MPRKVAKSKRPEAERAGEWYLREVCGCVVTRRALRTKYAKVDFYCADIIGKHADGSCVYAQATAGGNAALRIRRRKLETVPWHESEKVMVLQLTFMPDPANMRRKLWFFRVHRYDHVHDRNWRVDSVAEPVPKAWFKAWKDVGDSG